LVDVGIALVVSERRGEIIVRCTNLALVRLNPEDLLHHAHRQTGRECAREVDLPITVHAVDQLAYGLVHYLRVELPDRTRPKGTFERFAQSSVEYVIRAEHGLTENLVRLRPNFVGLKTLLVAE
jgi:hypothetical protein